MGKLLHFLLENTIFQDLLQDLQVKILYVYKNKEEIVVNIECKCLFHANDLDQGLIINQQIQPQIVILQLPLREAYEFAAKLKHTKVRIIVISEEKEADAILSLLSLGVRFIPLSVASKTVLQHIHESLYELSLVREVEKQKQWTRAILEFQEDMVFIIEDDEIIDCNLAFIQFIGCSHVSGYRELLHSFSASFVNEAGYYYSENKIQWLHDCLQVPKKVKMKNEQGVEKVFLIRATTMPDDGTRFIVLCTNLTQFDFEVKEKEKLFAMDSLTNLYNRCKFEAILTDYCSSIYESDINFSIVLLNLDNFQAINDKYGRDVGDLLLAQLAELLSKHLEMKDVAARWNGDTFSLLLPELSWKEAFQKAEKLRFFIETKKFSNAVRMKASFGVAAYEKGLQQELFIRRAEIALEEAKRRGKNQVFLYKKDKM